MKQQQLMDATHNLRYAAIEHGVICEGLNCGKKATDCHEITAGSHRQRALEEPLVQMHLCRECHEAIQGAPYANQIAWKIYAICDAVNRCTDSVAVTVGEVRELL